MVCLHRRVCSQTVNILSANPRALLIAKSRSMPIGKSHRLQGEKCQDHWATFFIGPPNCLGISAVLSSQTIAPQEDPHPLKFRTLAYGYPLIAPPYLHGTRFAQIEVGATKGISKGAVVGEASVIGFDVWWSVFQQSWRLICFALVELPRSS